MIWLLLCALVTPALAQQWCSSTLWAYWEQGEQMAPRLTQLSFMRMKAYADESNWQVNIVDASSI